MRGDSNPPLPLFSYIDHEVRIPASQLITGVAFANSFTMIRAKRQLMERLDYDLTSSECAPV